MAAAGQVAGWEFNQDPNSGNMLGLSWAQINDGVRATTRFQISDTLIFQLTIEWRA